MSPMSSITPILQRTLADYAWIPVAGPIPLAEYESAEQLIAERARTVSGVLGVYRFGPVRFPGLSDLDALVVVENDFADFESLRPLLREALPPATHRVVLHDPYFVRRAELDALFQFTPIFRYEAIWAAPGLPTAGQNSAAADLWLFLLDIIAESYPREFIQFLLARDVDERLLIGRVKGLAYCFELLARLTGRRDEAFEQFAAEVESLRSNFFSLPTGERSARSLTLAQRAIPIAHRLALEAASAASATWGLKVQGRLDLWCAGNPAIYTDHCPADPSFGSVHLRRTEVFTPSPAIFGWLVREYARATGPFSERLAARLTDHLRVAAPPPGEIQSAIRRRAELRNAHTAWADRSGLGISGFLTFGFRMRRRQNIPRALKEATGRLIDRARESLLRRRMSVEKI